MSKRDGADGKASDTGALNDDASKVGPAKDHSDVIVSRRSFLAGVPALGIAGVGVAALGVTGAAGIFYSRRSVDPSETPTLVPLYSSDRIVAAGMTQRIPFAVVDDANVAGLTDDAPVAVSVIRDGERIDELTVTGRVVEHDHVGENVDPDHQHSKLFRYYPLRANLPEPGIYDLEVDFGGVRSTMPVQAFAQSDVAVLLPGQPMPPLESATTDEPRDVDTLCTRFVGQCPFHESSVADLLTSAKPMVVLVATPALCATAYCGPVLDLLIDARDRYPDIEMVHIEPYANTAEVGNNYADPSIRLADSVVELGLEFEPSLFLVDSSGNLTERIDNLFDASELEAALQSIA